MISFMYIRLMRDHMDTWISNLFLVIIPGKRLADHARPTFRGLSCPSELRPLMYPPELPPKLRGFLGALSSSVAIIVSA